MKKIVITHFSDIYLETEEEFPKGIEEQLKKLLDSGEELNPFEIPDEYKEAFKWIIDNMDRGEETYSVFDIVY